MGKEGDWGMHSRRKQDFMPGRTGHFTKDVTGKNTSRTRSLEG